MSDPLRTPPSWAPLFVGSEAQPLIQRAQDVALALRTSWAAAFSEGDWGLPLLEGYFGRACISDPLTSRQLTTANLECAAEALARAKSPWLYGSGWAGLSWMIAHLGADGGAGPYDVEEINQSLMELLASRDWSHNYDLISGLVGLAVYACEARAGNSPDPLLIEAIVRHLLRLSKPSSVGITWLTEARLLPEWQRQIAPSGYYNLGAAHGIPGILWVLARSLRLGLRSQQVEDALEEGVRWLLAQRNRSSDGLFPSWVAEPPGQKRQSGFSWCYGGLGISLTLLSVARDTRRRDWAEAALDIGRTELEHGEREERGGRPVDAGICHGMAGVAHLFNRLYHFSGAPEFAVGARLWFMRALSFGTGNPGIAGFQSWTSERPQDQFSWKNDPKFLTGASGSALALLAAATSVEPRWDAVLLVPQQDLSS